MLGNSGYSGTQKIIEPSKRRDAIFHLLPFYVCPSVADILISGLSKALHTVVGTTEGRVSYFLKFSSGIGWTDLSSHRTVEGHQDCSRALGVFHFPSRGRPALCPRSWTARTTSASLSAVSFWWSLWMGGPVRRSGCHNQGLWRFDKDGNSRKHLSVARAGLCRPEATRAPLLTCGSSSPRRL